jgi:hypothetical protein
MSAVGAVFSKLGRVPFIVWLWIIQLFLLINAPIIAPAGQVDTLRTILIIYIIAEIMFLDFLPKVPGGLMNLNQAIPWMVGGLIVAVVVVTGIGFVYGFEVQSYALSSPIYLTVLHTAVVGVSETFIYQATLPKLITPIPAQILFGLFHVSAYGGDIVAMVMAIMAGLVFYAVTKYTNMFASMGAHAGYNTAVLHLLSVI